MSSASLLHRVGQAAPQAEQCFQGLCLLGSFAHKLLVSTGKTRFFNTSSTNLHKLFRKWNASEAKREGSFVFQSWGRHVPQPLVGRNTVGNSRRLRGQTSFAVLLLLLCSPWLPLKAAEWQARRVGLME